MMSFPFWAPWKCPAITMLGSSIEVSFGNAQSENKRYWVVVESILPLIFIPDFNNPELDYQITWRDTGSVARPDTDSTNT